MGAYSAGQRRASWASPATWPWTRAVRDQGQRHLSRAGAQRAHPTPGAAGPGGVAGEPGLLSPGADVEPEDIASGAALPRLGRGQLGHGGHLNGGRRADHPSVEALVRPSFRRKWKASTVTISGDPECLPFPSWGLRPSPRGPRRDPPWVIGSEVEVTPGRLLDGLGEGLLPPLRMERPCATSTISRGGQAARAAWAAGAPASRPRRRSVPDATPVPFGHQVVSAHQGGVGGGSRAPPSLWPPGPEGLHPAGRGSPGTNVSVAVPSTSFRLARGTQTLAPGRVW